MHKKTKKAMTLLEIMIVIFLIGLIGSVIGYNMKGSLDEGRAFKTEQGIAQIKDILQLEIAQGHTPELVARNAEDYLRHSGMVKDPKKFLKDGWGNPYVITATPTDISVVSAKWNTYKATKKSKLRNITIEEEQPEEE